MTPGDGTIASTLQVGTPMEHLDGLHELAALGIDGDFVCLDTETANDSRDSLCAIGAAVVRDGDVVAVASELIDPGCEFDDFNTGLHGIDEDSVVGARTLDKAWADLAAITNGRLLAFHNAAFDVSVLRSSGDRFGGLRLSAEVACTLRLARRVWPEKVSYGLAYLAYDLDLSLEHHDAGSDAEACARIALAMMESAGVADLTALHDFAGMRPGVIEASEYRPIWARRSDSVARRIEPDPHADPGAPLHGLTVCFTGTLESMPRKAAAALVAAAGGTFLDAMTKEVDLLVVGSDQYRAFTRGKPTTKLRRAIDLRAKDRGPEIVGEADFLQLLDGPR